MEQIPDRIDSTFRYILIAAKRAEQLVRGAKPRLEMPNRKPSRVAMREVVENLVDWDYGPAPVPEPVEAPTASAAGSPPTRRRTSCAGCASAVMKSAAPSRLRRLASSAR